MLIDWHAMLIDKLKYRKSAGVPVSGKVHTILKEANDARSRGDHAVAVALYRDALDRDPSLAHIWIQCGHMLRKIGDYGAAEGAYNEALRLKPESDPHLHLGHLYKETGQIGSAARSYIAAVRADRSNGDALVELHMLMARNIEITPEDIMAITDFGADGALSEEDPVSSATMRARSALDTLATTLRRDGVGDQLDLLGQTEAFLEALHSRDRPDTEPAANLDIRPVVLFDVSDLISYFDGARLPTGIQRVQIEVIRSALRNGQQSLRVCAFLNHRDEWVEIPPAMFLLLCRLCLSGGDLNAPEWISTLTKLRLTMAMSEPLTFPRGAFLVNLGTSWWLQNYFLYVRKAKAEFGIHYVPFVHDVIPVMASEHCTKELTRDFISWAMGAFEHADYFFVNSEATKRDLFKVAAILGQEVSEEKVVVIRLDADFRKPVSLPLPRSELAKWGIGRADFVLFISTIESRKNHIGAFDAWINLLREYGARRVPKLVCVGNKGWLNDAVYARLEAHDELREKVIMLSGLSDAELDLLYRTCIFTLYPSNYEGWGLPVTESLCYGKVPLISDASSLPEAGGPFAHYFEAGSTPRLSAALEQLIFDPAMRAEREANISREFSPRTWDDIAAQLSASMQLWAEDVQATGDLAYRVPVATLGAYHPIVRNVSTRIWSGMRSGEIFRAGAGWWGPDNWGCWTKAQGGTLEIGVPEDVNEGIRLYLQLHGLPSGECAWLATVAGAQPQSGVLAPGAFKWASFEMDAIPDDRVLRLFVEGSATVDLRTVTEGLDPRIVSVGVVGFFLCRAGDSGARSSFLEAVALSNLDNLAFNREHAEEPAVAGGSS